MKPEGSLSPCSQAPTTGPYHEPDKSSQCPYILIKIQFNIILPYLPRSPAWSLPFGLCEYNLKLFLIAPIRATFPAHRIPITFRLNNICLWILLLKRSQDRTWPWTHGHKTKQMKSLPGASCFWKTAWSAFPLNRKLSAAQPHVIPPTIPFN